MLKERNTSLGERAVLIGFCNPTIVYPAPLVAIVLSGRDYAAIYPDGFRETLNGNPYQSPDFIPFGTEARKLYRREDGKDDFIYGIKADHLVIGNREFVAKNLQEYIANLPAESFDREQIAEFIASLDLQTESPK